MFILKIANASLSAANNRFRRARSGSVLLIVVILLLMLTILGTAFVSTSHSDRISSADSVQNAQSDLTAQTVADAVISKVQQDLNDPSAPQVYAFDGTIKHLQPISYSGNFRGRIAYRGDYSNSTTPTTYYNFGDVVRTNASPQVFYYEFVDTVPTAGNVAALPILPATSNNYWQAINVMGAGSDGTYGTTDDTGAISLTGITSSVTQPWLADRYPTCDNFALPGYWQNISQPTLYSGTFESPDGTIAASGPPVQTFSPYTSYTPGGAASKLYPGYGNLNGTIVPILSTVPVATIQTLPGAVGANYTIAGNASGDGMGDSLLQRIPGMYADGLTWYAAVRVIDNNAAINVNTAYSRNADYDFSGNPAYPNWGLFQSNIALQELPLNNITGTPPYTDMTGTPATPALLNSYRFNGTMINSPVDDSRLVHNGNLPEPSPFVATIRSDMSFITAGDAFQHESIRRLENPGLLYINPAVTSQNPQTQYQRFQPFPASDTASLAYHFGLLNPLITYPAPPSTSGPYPSLLEDYLKYSLVFYNSTGATSGPIGNSTPYGQSQGRTNAQIAGDPASWVTNQFPWTVGSSTNFNSRTSLVTRNANSNYISPAYNPDPQHPGEAINSAMLTYGPNRATNRIQFRANKAGKSIVWDSTQIYQLDDAVLDTNTPPNTYVSMFDNNNNPLTTTTAWSRVGTNQGQWSAAIAYNPGDIVTDNGITFVRTTANLGMSGVAHAPGLFLSTTNGAVVFTSYNNLLTGDWTRPGQYMGIYDGSWDTGTPANTLYVQGDIVLNDVAHGGDGFTYVCVAANTTGVNGANPATDGQSAAVGGLAAATLESSPSIWQLQPYSAQPTRANANTATFRELFRAYWNVMAGTQGNLSPFGGYAIPGNPTANLDYDPYDYQGATLTPASTVGNPQHMFRSPLRDPHYTTSLTATYRMDYNNVMQLRAALAAVNTLAERDGSQNVISRTVTLNAFNTPPTAGAPPTPIPVQARVYSALPQPFISEVYADTDTGINDPNYGGFPNTAGYVAIELFNPYPFALTLSNWQAAYINRAVHPNMIMSGLGSATNPLGAMVQVGGTLGQPILIPPHEYALLENYNGATGATPVPGDAVFRPHAGGFATGAESTGAATGIWNSSTNNGIDIWVSGLQNAFNNEFVLLRPRRLDGTYTRYVDPTNPQNPENYDEGTPLLPNLTDLVPIDSYDFTGLAGAGTTFPEWAYIRPKGDATINGLFRATYPGRYLGDGVTGAPRQEGTAVALITTTTPEPAWSVTTGAQVPNTAGINPPSPLTWGTDFNPGTYINEFPAIQVYNCYGPGQVAGATYMPMHWPNAVNYPQISTIPAYRFGSFTNVSNATGNKFPFGGIPRNGDLLDVMYMGSYRIIGAAVGTLDQRGTYTKTTAPSVNGIDVPPATILEMNSLPMDCSFADSASANNVMATAHSAGTPYTVGAWVYDPANPQNYYLCIVANTGQPLTNTTYWQPGQLPVQQENIGRFCPMSNAPAGSDFYSWARNLFNYVTVQNYNDDYLPNVDPSPNDPEISNVNTTPVTAPTTGMDYSITDPTNAGLNASPYKYPGPRPAQVYNKDGTATNQVNQHNAGVEGLININTADWNMLNTLPMLNASIDTNFASDNVKLAQNIVAYRTANGPFLSIFDLNKVPGFQNPGSVFPGAYNPTTMSPTSAMGILNPPDPLFPALSGTAVTSGVYGDFAANNLMLSRISNLITTHSDNFTVYVEIQGWQNAVIPGTAAGLTPSQPAFPKITRRYAVIVDRSQMSIDPSTHYPKTIVVPNN